MKHFVAVVLSFVFLSLCAFAQQPNAPMKDQPKVAERQQNACGGNHKPGDHLTCYVIFDGDPELQGLLVQFQLQGAPAANQVGLNQYFNLNQMRKIGRGEYVIEGQLSDCVKGNYRLHYVSVSMRGVQRAYIFGTDFKDLIEVAVLNDVDLHFPKIKDISAEPPKEEKAAAVPATKN